MLSKREQRRMAISTAKSQLRADGWYQYEIDHSVDAREAWASLGKVAKNSPDWDVSKWYKGASFSQKVLFHREWRAHQKYWNTIDRAKKLLEFGDFDGVLDLIDDASVQYGRIYG